MYPARHAVSRARSAEDHSCGLVYTVFSSLIHQLRPLTGPVMAAVSGSPDQGCLVQRVVKRPGLMGFTAKTGNGLRACPARLYSVLVIAGMLFCGYAAHAIPAEPASSAHASRDFRSLDREIQVLKREVLELNRDLRLLEEEILYPDNRQLVVFISLADIAATRLDRATLSLGGQVLISHEYSAGEITALRQGGVHRLYEGALQQGSHYVEIAVTGQDAEGESFTASTLAKIIKRASPKFLELKLAGGRDGQSPAITVQGW